MDRSFGKRILICNVYSNFAEFKVSEDDCIVVLLKSVEWPGIVFGKIVLPILTTCFLKKTSTC